MIGRVRFFSANRKCGLTLLRWSIAVAAFAMLATHGSADEQQRSTTGKSKTSAKPKQTADGAEIFRREWVAGDPRSHGGDGLGPIFNESSCVACHNQGGVGGGGPVGKNVELLTARTIPFEQFKAMMQQQQQLPQPQQPQPSGISNKDADERIKKQFQQQIEQLAGVHPGFRESNTVVIHRFGIDEQHESWRRGVSQGAQTVAMADGTISNIVFTGNTTSFDVPVISPSQPQQFQPVTGLAPPTQINIPGIGVSTPAIDTGSFPVVGRIAQEIQMLKLQARTGTTFTFGVGFSAVQKSERNTTALFGAGLIDAIPAEAIEAAAAKKHADFPRISGRMHRLADGGIGRFGWKAQTDTLHRFTMTACAVEVGLHVPDHKQSNVPYKTDQTEPAGYDLNRDEVDALVDYLRELPQPVQRKPAHTDVAGQIDDGEELFASIGCNACHVKQLGEADGLFSDLLLHDMGPDLGSVGSYGVPSVPEEDPDVPLANADDKNAKPKAVGPTSQEWRTPPLWGVRDSAPYLHDGRAETLEQAIAFHGGEAADARLRFFMQPTENRAKVLAFLKSLVAPDAVAGRE